MDCPLKSSLEGGLLIAAISEKRTQTPEVLPHPLSTPSDFEEDRRPP
jgi:hypothetical protein